MSPVAPVGQPYTTDNFIPQVRYYELGLWAGGVLHPPPPISMPVLEFLNNLQEPGTEGNRVVVPARLATQPSQIGSLEWILGSLKVKNSGSWIQS